MTRLVTYVNGRKEATNGETLTNGHPSKTQPELNGRTTSKIDAVAPALTALRNSADEVLRLLQDEDVSPLLYKMLHDPDQLPDKKLSGLCSEVVDSLERVSLEITPSVSILSDGFFCKLAIERRTERTLTPGEKHIFRAKRCGPSSRPKSQTSFILREHKRPSNWVSDVISSLNDSLS